MHTMPADMTQLQNRQQLGGRHSASLGEDTQRMGTHVRHSCMGKATLEIPGLAPGHPYRAPDVLAHRVGCQPLQPG